MRPLVVIAVGIASITVALFPMISAADPLPAPGQAIIKSTGQQGYVSGVNCPNGKAPCAPVMSQYFERVEEVRIAGTGSCLRTITQVTGVLRAPSVDPAIQVELPQYSQSREYFMCQRLGPSDPGAACAGI